MEKETAISAQLSINNINKLGYWVDIVINEQGLIAAGIYTKPDHNGMSVSVLDPANETGSDIDNVLAGLTKRLAAKIKQEGKA